MIRVRYFATTILTMGALAVLPGCAGHEEAAAPAPTPAAAPAPAPAPTPAPMAEAPASQEVPLTSHQIRRIQFGLSRAGFYEGRVDGVMGPQTEAAVAKYQQQAGLQPTGRIDSATLQAMNRDTAMGRGPRGVPTQ